MVAELVEDEVVSELLPQPAAMPTTSAKVSAASGTAQSRDFCLTRFLRSRIDWVFRIYRFRQAPVGSGYYTF